MVRGRAQVLLPIELRQQLLDAIYAGQPFRMTLQELGLTPNQVWGLTKTDDEGSTATNAAYVAGCVCSDCREHQRVRMARNRRQRVRIVAPLAESKVCSLP
jgi:hypothetical protein